MQFMLMQLSGCQLHAATTEAAVYTYHGLLLVGVSPLSAFVTASQSAGGRYLNDVWLLNLDTLTWQLITTSAKSLPPIGGGKFDENELAVTEPLLGNSNDSKPGSTTALPPSAGHILVAWGSSLLCIGGHTKAGTYSHYRKVSTS